MIGLMGSMFTPEERNTLFFYLPRRHGPDLDILAVTDR